MNRSQQRRGVSRPRIEPVQQRNVELAIDINDPTILWYSLLNRWDPSIFETARGLMGNPPRTPGDFTFLSVAPLNVARNMLTNGYTPLANAPENQGDFYWSIALGNIEKGVLFLNTGLISEDEIVKTAERFQTIHLLSLYKTHMNSTQWNDLTLSGKVMMDILSTVKLGPKIREIPSNILDILFIIAQPLQRQLDYFNKIPDSWAERVPLVQDGGYSNLIDEVIRRKLPLEIVNTLLIRGAIPSPQSIIQILGSYPPSLRRDKVYYMALARMKISESELLEKYMHIDSSGKAAIRYRIIRSLFFTQGVCDADKKFIHGDCTNNSTLFTDIDEVPNPYLYRYTQMIESINDVGEIVTRPGSIFCFNLMEIAPELFTAKESRVPYQNPYTREDIPMTEIIRMTNIIMNLGNRGYPLYPLTPSDTCNVPIVDIPNQKERIEKLISIYQLEYYIPSINEIIQKYGAETVLASKNTPNILRYYNDHGDGLVDGLSYSVPNIENILKSLI